MSGATSILTLSPTGGSTTFSGMIQGGGTLGTISLVLSGSGTQVLSGSNTYTGTTTVNAGVLEFANAASLPGYTTSGSVTVAGGERSSCSWVTAPWAGATPSSTHCWPLPPGAVQARTSELIQATAALLTAVLLTSPSD